MTTNSISVSYPQQIRGISGLVVRLGAALERWGRATAEPLTHDELARMQAIRLEARNAVAGRGDAYSSGVVGLR